MQEKLPNADETSSRRGPPVDAALFSRVEQLIQSVRLTQDERVVVETRDVATDVHSARKEFEMGHLEQALRGANRISSAFDQKVAQWEQRARRKEQDKPKLSMLQIRKMNAEHAAVRTRVELVRAQIRRLRSGLDHMDKLAQTQAAASAETPAPPAEPSV